MRGAVRKLMKIARKEVEKKVYNQLANITDEDEKEDALKHTLINSIENKAYELERKIQYLKNYGKHVFFAEGKFLMLNNKINHFKATFSKEDYEKIEKARNAVKMEIANV
jgi:hypothetical protein